MPSVLYDDNIWEINAGSKYKVDIFGMSCLGPVRQRQKPKSLNGHRLHHVLLEIKFYNIGICNSEDNGESKF